MAIFSRDPLAKEIRQELGEATLLQLENMTPRERLVFLAEHSRSDTERTRYATALALLRDEDARTAPVTQAAEEADHAMYDAALARVVYGKPGTLIRLGRVLKAAWAFLAPWLDRLFSWGIGRYIAAGVAGGVSLLATLIFCLYWGTIAHAFVFLIMGIVAFCVYFAFMPSENDRPSKRTALNSLMALSPMVLMLAFTWFGWNLVLLGGYVAVDTQDGIPVRASYTTDRFFLPAVFRGANNRHWLAEYFTVTNNVSVNSKCAKTRVLIGGIPKMACYSMNVTQDRDAFQAMIAEHPTELGLSTGSSGHNYDQLYTSWTSYSDPDNQMSGVLDEIFKREYATREDLIRVLSQARTSTYRVENLTLDSQTLQKTVTEDCKNLACS